MVSVVVVFCPLVRRAQMGGNEEPNTVVEVGLVAHGLRRALYVVLGSEQRHVTTLLGIDSDFHSNPNPEGDFPLPLSPMAKTMRPGDVLRGPEKENGSRETVLAQIPDSWRTALAKADEWPFPNPDDMLDTPVESFGDYPSDSVPAEIVPFSEFEPWGKTNEETNRDYELFSYYRALGLSRTFSEVAKQFSISGTYVSRVANKHDWIERVTEWDKYREKIYTTEVIDRTRKMAEEHAEISKKGVRALSIAFDELLTRIENEDPVHLEEMKELPLRSLYAMVEKAARVLPNLMNAERLSRGLPTELSAQMVISENRVVLTTTDELKETLEVLGMVIGNAQALEEGETIDLDEGDYEEIA